MFCGRGAVGTAKGLRGLAAGRVGVSEFACPLVVAVGEGLMLPSGLVSDATVAAAEGCEVVGGGFSAVYPSGFVWSRSQSMACMRHPFCVLASACLIETGGASQGVPVRWLCREDWQWNQRIW